MSKYSPVRNAKRPPPSDIGSKPRSFGRWIGAAVLAVCLGLGIGIGASAFQSLMRPHENAESPKTRIEPKTEEKTANAEAQAIRALETQPTPANVANAQPTRSATIAALASNGS